MWVSHAEKVHGITAALVQKEKSDKEALQQMYTWADARALAKRGGNAIGCWVAHGGYACDFDQM